MSTSTIHITAPVGFSEILATEVANLGYTVTKKLPTGVEIVGSIADCMKLNLHLRTAHHVLFLLRKAFCRNADDLYKEVNSIKWELLIPSNGYFSVVSHVVNPTIRDTRFANLKCKDAVVDRIHEYKGRRPDSGSDRTRAVVSIFWKNDNCLIYLDTSGEPLSRRGYRKLPLDAPMQETLAAAVIMMSKWKPGMPFVNPMCGSGTLAIEAALLTANRAPGLTRDNFGFMHLVGYDDRLWDKLRTTAERAIIPFTPGSIIASDNRDIAVQSARKNAGYADVHNAIQFLTCDFAETPIPEQKGVVVFNPGYGIRMGDADQELDETYKQIGDFFKKKCAGYWGYVFTANDQLIRKIGLKHGRRIPFLSAKLQCWLYEYELYAGNKRWSSGGLESGEKSSESL